MRSEKEMMDLVLSLAEQDERIRIVTLEGSRANINIPKDEFQDYDITYFVSDIEPFISNDDWLNQFGNIIMMQKPEDMELFPPEEKGFSYLMLFDDYNKIDLTLLPLEELDNYLKGDKLIKVLIDKDCRIKRDIVPTDIDYHVRKPSAREYDDCCNEFWNVTPYVIKGLCRKEILFAIDHFNQIVRHEGCTGHSGTHRAHVFVDIRSEFCRTGTEQFGFCRQFHMDLQTHYCFVFHAIDTSHVDKSKFSFFTPATSCMP
jgi:aminoglycoside 6-adenylyltransferase